MIFGCTLQSVKWFQTNDIKGTCLTCGTTQEVKPNDPHWKIQKEKYKFIKSTKILTGSNLSTPQENTKKKNPNT